MIRSTPRVAAALTAAIAVAAAAMVIAAIGARTLVPYAIGARVLALDERNHNSGGSDVWLLQLDDGRNYFIDVVAARTILDGSRVDKSAWSRTITVDGRERRVGASRESVGPTVWAIAVAALATATALFRGSRRGRASRPSEPEASP